jgi:hypothetical protein
VIPPGWLNYLIGRYKNKQSFQSLMACVVIFCIIAFSRLYEI